MSDSRLVNQVLEMYGLEGAEYSLIKDKGKKFVWKVKAGQVYALKKMPGSPARVAWLARACSYLARAGVRVAPLLPTSRGSLWVQVNSTPFIISRWIDGKPPDYDRHWELILNALAAFHLGAKAFPPGRGEHARSHLDTWPENLARKRDKLARIKNSARETGPDDFSRLCLAYIDHFLARAAVAEKKLRHSCYWEWVSRVKKEICFCHQDFTPKNLRLVSDKVYVFDMDSITVDLPARDIRKIINKRMKKEQWDEELLRRTEILYRKYNPVNDDQWQVALIDLYFPHLFWGIVTKYYENRAPGWSKSKFKQRLEKMIKVELDKEKILAGKI